MKLLIVSSLFYPSVGGVQEVVKDIGKYFSKNVLNKVKVVTSLNLEKLDKEKNQSGSKLISQLLKFYPIEKEKYEGLSIYRLWLGGPENLIGYLGYPYRFIVTLYNLVKITNKFKPDIVNYHFPDDSSIFMFFLLIINDKYKLVLNIHGNDLMIFYKKSPHSFFIDYIISKSESIIVNSSYMESEFIKKFPQYKNKVKIIPNGIDVENIKKQPVKKYFDDRYAFFIGRIVDKKGVDILLKGFAEANVQNLKLLLEGTGEEYDRMVKLTADLKLDNKVKFAHGTFNRDETYQFMKGALFGVMPSRIEPFGMVALEMMAAGIPIIASKTGGLESILENGKTALMFENGNIEDLEEKIRLLSGDQKLREDLVKNSKLEVLKYDFINVHRLYEREFEKCLRK